MNTTTAEGEHRDRESALWHEYILVVDPFRQTRESRLSAIDILCDILRYGESEHAKELVWADYELHTGPLYVAYLDKLAAIR